MTSQKATKARTTTRSKEKLLHQICGELHYLLEFQNFRMSEELGDTENRKRGAEETMDPSQESAKRGRPSKTNKFKSDGVL
jgi:hypothetical protein